MTSQAEFQFLEPLWLLLLPLLPLLLRYCSTRLGRESAWQRLCDNHLLRHMTGAAVSRGSQDSLLWIIGALLGIGIIAAASPSWSRVSQPVMEASTARIIVLDMSRAMMVQDLRPNRFAHAVAAASEIIEGEFDGETGLIVFSASAFVVAPLSRDADTLLAFVDAMHPDTMPVDGYNLAQALETAAALLTSSVNGYGDILVLSAGDGDDEAAVETATRVADLGNRVSILAIGTEAGGPVVDGDGGLLRSVDGAIQLSRTNFSLLRRVAERGNGSMTIAVSDLANSDPLISRLGAASLVESTLTGDQSDRVAADDGVWLVWLMLPLGLILFRKNLVYALLVVPILVPPETVVAAGTIWQHDEQIAYEAYRQQDYETAIRLTGEALLRGASLYRAGHYELALEAFDDETSAGSMYNRGNSLVQLTRYAEAIEAYEKALQLQPGFVSARHNLRLARLLLQRQKIAAADGQDGDPNAAPQPGETSESTQTRIGYADELQGNPADEQTQGPGSGAEQLAGQVDPLARFDGEDPAEQRFVLRARGAEQMPQEAFIEGWISDLPETSTELYRRKFLRDYRQIRRQPK